jgi:ABC-type polysaccharide/polyol phosphate export permease
LGGEISWTIIFVPIGFLTLLTFGIGISLVVSVATVFFRDLQYVLTIGMQGLFYLTPVLYVKDMLPNQLTTLIELNPITPIIEIFRSPIAPRVLPDGITYSAAIFVAVIALALGIYMFQQLEKKIIFRL